MRRKLSDLNSYISRINAQYQLNLGLDRDAQGVAVEDRTGGKVRRVTPRATKTEVDRFLAVLEEGILIGLARSER